MGSGGGQLIVGVWDCIRTRPGQMRCRWSSRYPTSGFTLGGQGAALAPGRLRWPQNFLAATAKVSDHRATKGPSGTGDRIPVALPTLMLMGDVERTLTGWCTAAGLSAGESVESRLLACKAWVEAGGNGAAWASLAEQCVAWVGAITGMLNPLPRVEIKGACPNCFESHVSESTKTASGFGPLPGTPTASQSSTGPAPAPWNAKTYTNWPERWPHDRSVSGG
jgi:hypothetical protein